MKKIKRINRHQNIKLVIKVILFLALLLPIPYPLAPIPSADAAGQTLRISPIIINVPLSPGKVYRHEVLIENLTDRPLPLKANLSDFQTTGEEGGYLFEETKTNPLLSWVELDNDNLILNPKEKKKILLTITTPQKIPLGGYYGMVFFEPVASGTHSETTHVISKIGLLMLANIGVPNPNAKKAEFTTFTTGLLHQDSNIPLLLRVKNVSLHFFTAKPILSISPLLTLSASQRQPIYLEEKIVFPGKIRRWEQTLNTNLPPNIYKAHMQISTGNGEYISNDNYFVIFPWSKALLAIIIMIIILFLIKKRRRLKSALTALIRP
jgi:hypothetical protein